MWKTSLHVLIPCAGKVVFEVCLISRFVDDALRFLRSCAARSFLFTGIALLVTALIINWELGLVMLACVPFIGASVASLSLLMSGSSKEGADHYGKAGGVATEVS